MYSNVFDSVKTDTLDIINFEGLLYTSIISGLHPTLSLNQAVDSTALLSLSRQDDFLELVKKGYIRVALFNKYDGIYSFLNDKLGECVNKNKASFKFSSLPFLYDGRYDERQLVGLYKAMRGILNRENHYLTSSQKKSLSLDPNSDDSEKIEQYIELIHRFSEAVNGQYVLPPKNRSKSKLYKKVKENVDIYIKYIIEEERTNDERVEWLKDFKKILGEQRELEKKGQSKNKTNSRSYMYEVIKSLGCSTTAEKELKYLVDLCYNEIVAESIADDEDDIIINNNNYEYTRVYTKHNQDNTLDKCEQKLSLINTSRAINSEVFTWELLNEILREVNHNGRNSWYENMQKYCEELRLNIKSDSKMLALGTIFFLVTAIGTSICLKENIDPDNKILHQVLDAFILSAPNQIIAQLSSLKCNGLRPEGKQLKAKENLVKECLTQTELLKKDYCC